MAWRTGDGGRQFRKDASAAKRSETERQAVAEPSPSHKRKHTPAIKRKFGIEQKYVGPDYGRGIEFLQPKREWHMCWKGLYEKARDRDNAIQAFRKNIHPWNRYEYRTVDRE